MWILRAVILLALIVWLGGIIFFAFVVAPTLFAVLPTTQLAGNVVSVALGRLHTIGLICGVVFLICSIGYSWSRYARPQAFGVTNILMVVMLLLTAISQFTVTPRMQQLRSSNTLESPSGREQFDALHAWSTRLEGSVLFLGLAAVVFTARRFSERS